MEICVTAVNRAMGPCFFLETQYSVTFVQDNCYQKVRTNCVREKENICGSQWRSSREWIRWVRARCLYSQFHLFDLHKKNKPTNCDIDRLETYEFPVYYFRCKIEAVWSRYFL